MPRPRAPWRTWLGHAETRTTLDLYTHVLPALRDGIAVQLDGLLRTMQPQKRPE